MGNSHCYLCSKEDVLYDVGVDIRVCSNCYFYKTWTHFRNLNTDEYLKPIVEDGKLRCIYCEGAGHCIIS